ncbi:hypothetical protein J41TS4_35020 [Paenibacillus apis]|uniref:Uncharacterized protein n=1 Tax=Paenibacillus apis TaxID=1792174 RepID=A0A919Y3E6_9BACL|nr:hypothetical protein J41TS4_35020 [Paenibacillus apis]
MVHPYTLLNMFIQFEFIIAQFQIKTIINYCISYIIYCLSIKTASDYSRDWTKWAAHEKKKAT